MAQNDDKEGIISHLRESNKKNAPQNKFNDFLVGDDNKKKKIPKFEDFMKKFKIRAQIFFAGIFYFVACLSQVFLFQALNYNGLHYYSDEGDKEDKGFQEVSIVFFIVLVGYFFLLIAFMIIGNYLSKNISKHFHSIMVIFDSKIFLKIFL